MFFKNVFNKKICLKKFFNRVEHLGDADGEVGAVEVEVVGHTEHQLDVIGHFVVGNLQDQGHYPANAT